MGAWLKHQADALALYKRWSNVFAHESAFTGASFEKWWADYQPLPHKMGELQSMSGQPTSSFCPRGSNQRVVDLNGTTVILGRAPDRSEVPFMCGLTTADAVVICAAAACGYYHW